ncbi:group IID secretory phospholipase A2 isoform X2 [Tupaia chinensis]|nr:group IID secretory phospholipase A2 isoform X2 [Tupaia chinensis]
MIKQVTGKTPILSYWPYGCHCGLGGRGQPKDATDWCCHAHDCCYAYLKAHKCRIHSDLYKYSFSQGDIHCSSHGTWCEQQLCACDKEMAFCLQRNLGTYQKSWRYLRRASCQGQKPGC